MVQELPRRTGAGGPALVRLLARLTEADVAAPAQALPGRLSRWLGWADAIALSAALNSAASSDRSPIDYGQAGHRSSDGGSSDPGSTTGHYPTDLGPTVPADVRSTEAQSAGPRTAGPRTAESRTAGPRMPSPRSAGSQSADPQLAHDGRNEYARVRADLEQAIAVACGFAASAPRGQQRARARKAARPEDDAQGAEYATYRQRYVALQQSMEDSIRDLRGRLRAMLASMAPDMAGLAMVDAAMEQALAEREQSLLLKAPALLEGRFERLQRGEAAAGADDERGLPSTAAAAPGAWLAVFREDMRRILLAELDIRLQPIEGLLSALRACSSRTL